MSQLFEPFRAIGYVCDVSPCPGPAASATSVLTAPAPRPLQDVPAAVQQRGTETFAAVAVGRSFQLFGCERLNLLFMLVASREPTAAERDACMGLLGKLKGRYADNDKDAQAFLSVGDSPRDKKFNAAEHAAWAQVSLTVLASDIALRVY